MHLVITDAFKAWLKANNNIKLSSNAAVIRTTYKGITTYTSLKDFDTKSIESLPATYKVTILVITEGVVVGITTEQEILGANISSISLQALGGFQSDFFIKLSLQFCPSILLVLKMPL